jgi:hypothetical protein
MLMFFSILLASVIVFALFAAIASAAEPARKPPLQLRLAAEPSKFFAGDVIPVTDGTSLPAEMVLSQIERHIRLEQAAAERFVNMPTPESLHSPTASPFVN